jgi:outer membrane protein, heavy metal efflux system
LKKAYYELYFVQRERAINFEIQKLMNQFVAVTRRQYEVGKANQSDVLKAEVSLAELIKSALNLEKDKVEKEAALQRILGRSEMKEFGWIKDIDSDLPDYTFEQIMPVVRENNPELKAQTLNTELNRAELSLAKNSFGPDLMAKGTYKAMQGYTDDVWDLMLGVSVPVAPWSYQKYASLVKESRFSLSQSENEYAAKENALAADLKNILAQIQATGKLEDLYSKDWIPRLVQTMESVLSAYQTGKVDVLTVLDTYRTFLMARNDYEMSVRDYMSAQADLEKITGQSVEALKEKIK